MTNSSTDTAYAPGKHVLLDFWGVEAKLLGDENVIASALRQAAEESGATVLEIRLHHFGEGQGVTGMALLAESHITIHTWPETGYAALDIFMCGACDAEHAISPLRKALLPQKQHATVLMRGRDTK